MKTFRTSGTGSQQTISPIESDKMPIYETMADAEADLANLEEGQLVGIEDTGNELAHPVDAVEAGNLHAVTSNAVAEAIGEWETLYEDHSGSTGICIEGREAKDGKYLSMHLQAYNGNMTLSNVIPVKYRPAEITRIIFTQSVNSAIITAFANIDSNGTVYIARDGNYATDPVYGDGLVKVFTKW